MTTPTFPRTLALLSLLAAVSLLVACGKGRGKAGRADAPSDDALVLQSYTVPAGYASEVETLLTRLLNRGRDVPPAGRCYQAGETMVVVAAPASVQAGVPDVVDAFAQAQGDAAAGPRNVRMTYWMVAGDPAAEADLGGLPTAVADALRPIAAVEPPLRYSVLHQQVLTTLDGERGQLSSSDGLEVTQTVSLAPGGSLVADVDLTLPEGIRTWTRLAVRLDQLVVLGEGAPRQGAGAPERVFFVIRPELLVAP